MLAVKGFSRLFTNEKLLNISNIQKKNIQLVLTSSSLPGPGDEGLVPWLKALGPDISGLRGTSRGGAEVGSGPATDGTSPLTPQYQKPQNGTWQMSRGSSHIYKAEALLLICQTSGDTVGFLGNKSMYKTLQRRSRYPYKMIVAWCGVRLVWGTEARKDQMAPPPPKWDRGRAITATDRLLDPGESQLGFAKL